MATYPIKITLPYRVSKSWLEERLLAGELVEARHELNLELDRLDPEMRKRALAVWLSARERGSRLEVIPSGISPDTEFQNSSDPDIWPTIVDPIVEKLGLLPEVPEPTDDPAAVFDAYEQYVRRYCDLAGGALAQWIDQYATDDFDPETGDIARGLHASHWIHEIDWRVGEEPERRCRVDGRKNLELFRRANAAYQLQRLAFDTAEREDKEAAVEVVGGAVVLERKPTGWDELVAAYEDQCDRLARVTLARFWTRQRQRSQFEVEMTRWITERGSERLKMGLEDGYRMIAVYLRERLDEELPGFYAWQPEAGTQQVWQPRHGPTDQALRLRRAVQDKLAEHTPVGQTVPEAKIGWVKNVIQDLCDESKRVGHDYDGDLFLRDEPFEAIVVPGWQARYSLIAAVASNETPVPDYVLNEYILKPSAFGVPAHDIPFEVGDFTAAPTGDDDIPF